MGKDIGYAQGETLARLLSGIWDEKWNAFFILVKTVEEFKGMNPKDVVSYIEGEPFISIVSIEPGQ